MLGKSKRLVVASVAAIGMVAATAGAANAANQDGHLDFGEAGFYYNSGCVGSMSDFAQNEASLSGFVFLSTGAGKGQPVKNNAACVENLKYTNNLRVYYNSNYQGLNDLIPAGEWGNLTNTYNENASFKWV